MRRNNRRVAGLVPLLFLMACEGTSVEVGVGGSDGEPPVAELPAFVPSPAALHRLTRQQYRNTVVDLLGDGLTLPVELEVDTLVDGLTAVGATEVPISSRGVELYDDAARALASQVFADAGRRQGLVGCTPVAGDDACARAFLARFGRRAWRRPLTQAEVDRYAALSKTVAGSLSSAWTGLEYAVSALLQSPAFLHRVELGEPDPAHPGWFRYTGYELASRLSYFLWNGPPDEALLTAAESGALVNPDGLKAEVARMVASARVRPALLAFLGEHLAVGGLDTLQRDAALFPRATATLGPSMRQELDLVLGEYALAPTADLRDLLTAQTTWVNPELAALYGMPAPSGSAFARVAFPAGQGRAGLMGLSGLLAITSHPYRTSPTGRGVFLRRRLLCQVIAPPPPNAVDTLDAQAPAAGETLRQRLQAHRENPACAGCHAAVDPVGLGLERYDAVGAHRTAENGQPVDSRGELDGAAFDGAAQLGAALRSNVDFTDCVARRLYSHAVGHAVQPEEARPLAEAIRGFDASGYRLLDLAAAIALSEGFRSSLGQR